jgi:O-antigen/teichoic acid export membrane protein
LSLARHTAYNIAGRLLPLALILLTVPIYLNLIGDARYGVLALVWLFFGCLGLIDLGLGSAIAQRLASRVEATADEQAQSLWTAIALSAGLGTLGAALGVPLGTWFIVGHHAMDAGLRAELHAALPWAALLVPITCLSAVATGALQARRAFGELNVLVATSSSLVTLAPLAVAWTVGPQLRGLVATVVCARVIALLLMFWRCRVHYLSGQPARFDSRTARQLLGFGGWASVSAVVSPLMVALDRFMIGDRLGARAVSDYTIPYQLAQSSTGLSSALNEALFPRLAGAASETERAQLALRAVQVVAALLSPLAGAALLLAEPFFAWWISPEQAARSTGLAQILVLAFWANSLALVPFTRLLANGRPDLIAKGHLIELLPFFAALHLGLQYAEVTGAALAFALRVSADCLLLAWFAGMLKTTLRHLLVPAALLAAILGTATAPDIPPLWRWLGGGALVTALTAWSLRSAPAPLLRRVASIASGR